MSPSEIIEKMQWHLKQLQVLQAQLPAGKKASLASYTMTGAPLILIDGGADNIVPAKKAGTKEKK